MPNLMTMPNPVESGRRMFARVWARELCDGLQFLPKREQEYWLESRLETMLTNYASGLERIANAYHKIACDAICISTPAPFVVQDSRDSSNG